MFRVSKEAWAALDKALEQARDDKQARKAAWEAWEPYGLCPECSQRIVNNRLHNLRVGWCEQCQAITY